MGAELQGLLAALGAAVAFGVQYAPVKRYEIFDGATFQWFMCSGILMVGFLIALFTGNLQEGACCSNTVIFGGVLWALSNYFVLPLVKLLGIGLGFSLYHFVNLMVGYTVGRFGLFSVPRLQGDLLLCDLGCCMVLVSFAIMAFIEVDETEPKRKGSNDLSAPLTPTTLLPAAHGPSTGYRESYRRWRLGGDIQVSPGDKVGFLSGVGSIMFGLCSSECSGDEYHAVSGFGLVATPRTNKDFKVAAVAAVDDGACRRSVSEPQLCESGSLVERLLQGRAASAGSSTTSARLRLRLAGVSLAIAGGGLCGVQSVPATLHNAAFPGQSPLAVVFPQCLGIWVASSLIYIAYSTVARLWGWPVPHSVIRPAYVSGCIWCVGFALMIVGIRDLGYSVGYTLDAVGPIVVSSLLSFLVFREISGAAQVMLYFAALTLQLMGVLLIANFGQAAA